MTARLTPAQIQRLARFVVGQPGTAAPVMVGMAFDVHAAALACQELPTALEAEVGRWANYTIAGIPVVLDGTLPPGEVVMTSVVRMNLGPLDEALPAPPSATAAPMASAAADAADWRDTVRRRARRTDPPRGHVGGPAR